MGLTWCLTLMMMIGFGRELIRIEQREKREQEARNAQESFEIGEKFITGLDHEGLVQKCEILNVFNRTLNDAREISKANLKKEGCEKFYKSGDVKVALNEDE